METSLLAFIRNFCLMRTCWCLIFALSILLLYTSIAQGAGFTVTPMIQEVVLGEGEAAKTYDATVANESDSLATLEISVIDFGSLDESGGVAFLGASGELDERYALASWMQPETSEVTLQPGEVRSVKVRIENRESLSPGGHYGALVFKTVSTTKPDIPSVAINQIFSSLVLVKKTGGAVYGLDLVSVEHPDQVFSFGATVVPRFKNPGNVHVVPRGVASVTDPLGRLVYRGVLNEGSAIILPETFREFPFKLFPVEKAFVPGAYVLTLQYRYDGKDAFETWSKRSFLFPPLLTSILAALFTLSLVAFGVLRRRGRRSV
ncbi:MAG: hypothetical protein IPJ68_06130 [Candidatus Moraniibacteriota bacterium]|nr:MAG: hypothetical protein IPJ68_06130 [Candidatus Moranbacteria bacterium]